MDLQPSRLATALGGGQLVLQYQPIVEPSSGTVRAAETLARWRRPDGTLESAGWLFARIGHDADLLRELDRTTLEHVLEDRAASERLRTVKISLNQDATSVSLESMRRLADAVAGRAGGPFAVEFAEQLSEAQLASMAAIGEELADAGIEVWHDDFGTGERALPHLIALPSTVVKLAPELAAEGVQSPRVRRHVRSLIAMFHNLGKIVIAEGAGDAESAEWLAEAGADWLQGWHHARPMVAVDASRWLAEQERDAA
jgi:EAL domain-containing protein (putative c-di-GMP-specific phosphodiesterase class I)